MADAVLAGPPRLGDVRVLAIDGPSGAGKSCLAAEVTEVLRARGVRTALVSTDDFATWDDPVAWWPRLADGVLTPLAKGLPGRYRRTEWAGGTPRPGLFVDVDVPEVLVLEGVSAGRTSVRPVLTYLHWIAGPDAPQRLERAVARDGEDSRAHLSAWQEFERGWFAVDGTAAAADNAG
ncbi:uridine kinase [Amycolatopsis suaedae]|uniref:Uridine kinase n=1 Tax=Amycolatopsis suaedae TaxID=2510978 RepID=A0A4Q7JF98_9PSEU|nr:uridine kinase [Amycolatopsis suaedae]